MRFLCVNCGYIYDEALGDIADDIDPGTCIDQIPEDVMCPVCGESFQDFAPIEDEVIYVDNPDHLNHIERMHLPHIIHHDAEKIEVCIGEEDEMHPSEEDHRITAIYLVDDEGHILDEVFIMQEEDPIAEFDISGLENFEIRASCSRHGLWSGGLLENV